MVPLRKLVLTHFMLNLYLLVLIQPALPVLDYLLNYDYIVNQLCENRSKPLLNCNGKCYLEDELDKQLDISHDEHIPMPPKIDFEKFIAAESGLVLEVPKRVPSVLCLSLMACNLKDSLHANTLFRPPIV